VHCDSLPPRRLRRHAGAFRGLAEPQCGSTGVSSLAPRSLSGLGCEAERSEVSPVASAIVPDAEAFRFEQMPETPAT